MKLKQPSRLTKRAELANEKSSKKGADENEPYEINIEQIVMKIVLLDHKIVV